MKKNCWSVSVVLIGAVFLVLWGSLAAARAQTEPVAIVYALSGSATVRKPPGMKPAQVQLFEWLPVGTALAVGPEATLALALQNGTRYELAAHAKARLAETQLVEYSGPVVRLEAVPALPRVSPIAAEETRVSQAGMVRIRRPSTEKKFSGLYPFDTVRVLADQTVLQFTALLPASGYRVAVEESDGEIVFQKNPVVSPVHVPAGTLKPDTQYYWIVETLDDEERAVWVEERFATLPTDAVQRRVALKTALEKAGDASSLALLAELDRGLGLLAEAREEFQAALVKAPNNTALQQKLEELDKALSKNNLTE